MAQVTVVLPTWRSEATIDRALGSLLAQTFTDFDVVVVDDASGDGSFERIRERYECDPRLRFIARESNGGPSAARNTGIEAATGEWIALLDADDAWVPERLEVLLSNAGGADFIADTLETWDAWAQTPSGPYFDPFGRSSLSLEDLLLGWVGEKRIDAGFLKPMMRRRFLKQHQLAYNPTIRVGEDYFLYCTALCLGAHFKLVDFPGYLYTTPMGKLSRKRSPHSATSTIQIERLAEAITELRDRFLPQLSETDQAAFADRIYTLQHIAPGGPSRTPSRNVG